MSEQSGPFGRKPTDPTEADYLAYLIDECELNQWQREAFASMFEQLQTGKRSWLSEKQVVSMMKAVKEFGLTDDIRKGFLYRGYASDTRKPGTVTKVASSRQIANVSKDTYESRESSPHLKNYFDDMDDDIPF
jgi:hypothetical protein